MFIPTLFARQELLLWGAALSMLSAPLGAASLAPLQGQAVLGQTLDVRVPVEHANEGAPELGCARVTLWQGDQQGSAAAAEVLLEPVSPERSRLRVRSKFPVSEVYVSLQVDWVCGGAVSRRYTLLSELMPTANSTAVLDATLPVAAPVPPPRSSVGATVSIAGAATAAAAAPPRDGSARLATAASRASPRPAIARSAAQARAPQPGLAAKDAKAVLRLAAVGEWLDQPIRLRLSPELVIAAPLAGASGSASVGSASTGSWGELRTAHLSTPEELASGLRANASAAAAWGQERQRLSANAQGLRSELDAARAERYANPLVFGLLALSAVAVAWGIRQRQQAATSAAAWWESRLPEDRPVAVAVAPGAAGVNGLANTADASMRDEPKRPAVVDPDLEGLSVHSELTHSAFLGAQVVDPSGPATSIPEPRRGGVGVDLDFTALEADAKLPSQRAVLATAGGTEATERTVAMPREDAGSAAAPPLELDFELEPLRRAEFTPSPKPQDPAADPPPVAPAAPAHATEVAQTEYLRPPAAGGPPPQADLSFSQSDFDAFDKALSALAESSSKRAPRK